MWERRLDDVDLLIIYTDGRTFGGHQVVGLVASDREIHKHLLGLADGATQKVVMVKGLLEDLV